MGSEKAGHIHLFRVQKPLRLEAVHDRDDAGGLGLGVYPLTEFAFGHAGFDGVGEDAPDYAVAVSRPGVGRVVGRHGLRRQHREQLDQARNSRVVVHDVDEALNGRHTLGNFALFTEETKAVQLVPVFQNSDQKALFGAEMMEETGLGKVGPFRDFGQRRTPVAVLGELLQGDVKDALPPGVAHRVASPLLFLNVHHGPRLQTARDG